MGLFGKKQPNTSNSASQPTEKPKKQNTRTNNSQTGVKGNELSALAKKYGIRVSNPYGYYPEDVDKILEDLEKQLVNLSKENQMASSKIDRLTKERDSAKTELSKLKLQVSLMEVPDTSTEEDFQMFSRLATINPAVDDLKPKALEPSDVEVVTAEPIIADKIETQPSSEPAEQMFDDLVAKSTRKTSTRMELPADEQTPKPKSRSSKTQFDLEILGGNN